MPGRKTQTATNEPSIAEAQRQKEAERRMRLECMKIAVEMRTVVTKADGLIIAADKLVKYANTGKVEEK